MTHKPRRPLGLLWAELSEAGSSGNPLIHFSHPEATVQAEAEGVTARKDGAPTAGQAAIANLAGVLLLSGGGGLIQTTSG